MLFIDAVFTHRKLLHYMRVDWVAVTYYLSFSFTKILLKYVKMHEKVSR